MIALAALVMIVDTIRVLALKTVDDVKEAMACSGKIVMTCWEKCCEDVCYPEYMSFNPYDFIHDME